MEMTALPSHKIQLPKINRSPSASRLDMLKTSSEFPDPTPKRRRMNGVLDQSSMVRTQSEPMSPRRPESKTRSFHADASIVLIGIRGCGKRSLGFIAATALGWRFITEDHYFQEITGYSRSEYLKINGNQPYQARQIEAAQQVLEEHKLKCVIELGLVSLNTRTQEYLRGYALSNPVIYLNRDINVIQNALGLSPETAKSLERADLTHRRCSNYEFHNLEDYSNLGSADAEASNDRQSSAYAFQLRSAKEDFTDFVKSITRSSNKSMSDSPFSLAGVPLEHRLFTHAVEFKLTTLANSDFPYQALESAGDTIEICVDRWLREDIRSLGQVIAEIRRHLKLPVIIGVNYDKFRQQDGLYVSILDHGLRLGADYLVVDMRAEKTDVAALIERKGSSRIIGHLSHDVQGKHLELSWQDPIWMSTYQRGCELRCDVVRLLRAGRTHDDNEAIHTFTEKVKSLPSNRPSLVAYNTGELGRTSQILSPILGPVTYVDEPSSDDDIQTPGVSSLVTARQAVRALFASFILDPLRFYIFGADVSFSLSPLLHNAAYKTLGLQHTYQTRNIVSFEDIRAVSQVANFGGASIVQPWKVAIVDHLVSRSNHAEIIGAVNTLIPLHEQQEGGMSTPETQANQRNRCGKVAGWYGDNTDWVGIRICIERNLSPRNVIRPAKTAGLVIGAGGMARAAVYALLRLGCRKIFIHNRTLSNATKIAKHFNDWASKSSGEQPAHEVVQVLQEGTDKWPAGIEMPTLIVSCIPAHSINGQPPPQTRIPPAWLQSPTGGVFVEMAYKPLETPRLTQMRAHVKETALPWVLVDGTETLTEQAIAQFELMTGRRAPRRVMREQILKSGETHAG